MIPAQNTANTATRETMQPINRAEILRSIIRLAIPTFGQLIAEPIFVLIDTAIVGHLGRASLAGLSIGSTVLLTIAGLCLFLAYNTTSQVARLLGSGKRREGMNVGMDGIWIALTIGVIISIAVTLFAQPLCYALGARGTVLHEATVYTLSTIPGLPAILLVYAANGIFRGLQKVQITLFAAVSGALINTILDILLVFGMNLNILGSGIATLIAQWYMGLVLTIPVIRWAIREGARMRPSVHHMLRTAGSGIPLFIRTLALRACIVATVMSAARLGTNTLAAYQAANSCWNFVMNILDAIGIAAQTIVATSLGGGLTKQAGIITRICAQVGAMSSIPIGALLTITGWLFASAFSAEADIQLLIAIGLSIIGIFLPLAGWMWALDGVLIGAGDHHYLARACSFTAVIYILSLLAINEITMFYKTNDIVRTAALWITLNVIYIGGRAITNRWRIRNDQWMFNSTIS